MQAVKGHINTITYVLLAVFAPLFTVWLIEYPLNYALYVFEVALMLLFFNLFLGKPKKIVLNLKESRFIDYAFLIMALLLLSLNLLEINSFIANIFALILSFFLPGYVFLRMVRFNSLSSWLEWLALSFGLSVGITSIIYTTLLSFSTNNTIVLSILFSAIASIPVLFRRLTHNSEKSCSLTVKKYDLSEILLMVWLASFFFFIIFLLYPQMACIPGLDIVRHYSFTRVLISAPNYFQSTYPWFNALCATVYELSLPSMTIFQSGLACMSIITVVSFFVMAKIYLKQIDKKAPILATVFFSVFSGLGWLCFFKDKLSVDGLQFNILKIANDASYWDVGYGQGSWIWLWFRPMTIAIAIFFLLFYLIGRKDLSKRKLIAISFLLIVTLSLIHVPELILFNVFLLILSLLPLSSSFPALKEISVGSLAGSLVYFFYSSLSNLFNGIVIAPTLPTYFVLIVSALIACFLFHRPLQFFNNLHYGIRRKSVNFIAVVLIIVFIAGFLEWFSFPEIFSAANVYETQFVPLIIYPVLLGIVGFFGLHGVLVVNKTRNNPLIIFVILFFITFLFSELLSIINIEYLATDYGARRFIPIMFAALGVMASISIPQITSIYKIKQKFMSVLLLTFIVVSGITSTSLSVEYWSTQTNTPILNQSALDAIDFLSHNRDFNTPILTASSVTRTFAEYIPTPYVFDRYRYPIWSSLSPEVPLLLLYNPQNLPPYIYLDNMDLDYLSSNFENSYMANYLLQFFPNIFDDPEVYISKMLEGVPPSINSNVSLVVPDSGSKDYLFLYALLSFGGYDYTVCKSSDVKTIADKTTLIFPYDDESTLSLFYNSTSQISDYYQANRGTIVFNINGYGPLSELFFVSEDKTENVTCLCSLDAKLNLPVEVCAPELLTKSDVSILSWYSNNATNITKIPFVAELEINGNHLFYVNIYPLLNACLTEKTVSDSRQILNLLMNTCSDGQVSDDSTNQYGGLVYGANVETSPFGTVLNFDGKNSYISVQNSSQLNFVNALTIDAWVKVDDVKNGFCIASKKDDYSSTNGYAFLYDGNNFYLNFGNGAEYFSNSVYYGQLKSGVWNNLCVTYDGQSVTYFVNGVEVGSIKQSNNIFSNNLDLLIGMRQDGAWKLDGSIYKITLYNEALSTDEILQCYNKTNTDILLTFDKFNPLSSIVSNLIETSGLQLPLHNAYESWVFEGNTAFFKNVSFNGDIHINSSYIELSTDGFLNVTVMSDGLQTNLSNITRIIFDTTSYIKIRAEKAELNAGMGFYSNLDLLNPIITFSEKNVTLTLIDSNGQESEVTLGIENSELSLNGDLSLTSRTPTVKFNGVANFVEMYPLFSLESQLRSIGQNLAIDGTVEFKIVASDSYSFVSDFKWTGSSIRDPPLLAWDEFASLKNMLPWLVISILLIIICQACFKYRGDVNK